MRFGFSEDQTLFREAFAELLGAECTHEALAAAWQTETGCVPGLWERLAEMGVLGLTAPEACGGLGLGEVDLVLLLEEAGRAALPEPFAELTAVALPLLAEVGGPRADEWLPKLAAGAAHVAVALEPDRFVPNAAASDLLVVQRGDGVYALPASDAKLTPQRSVDGARRIYTIDFTPAKASRLAAAGDDAVRRAFNRGALAAAAQLLGLGRALVDLTVEYAKGRVQFGQPIGAFQAVKHHLADAHTKLEFARPAVYHAAYSIQQGCDSVDLDVSTAKALVSDAAHLCFRTALQCHGAIAYTYEYHAHMWMKRVLVLSRSWGDAGWHRRRAAARLLDT